LPAKRRLAGSGPGLEVGAGSVELPPLLGDSGGSRIRLQLRGLLRTLGGLLGAGDTAEDIADEVADE
jgi:hypothetical protein